MKPPRDGSKPSRRNLATRIQVQAGAAEGPEAQEENAHSQARGPYGWTSCPPFGAPFTGEPTRARRPALLPASERLSLPGENESWRGKRLC